MPIREYRNLRMCECANLRMCEYALLAKRNPAKISNTLVIVVKHFENNVCLKFVTSCKKIL